MRKNFKKYYHLKTLNQMRQFLLIQMVYCPPMVVRHCKRVETMQNFAIHFIKLNLIRVVQEIITRDSPSKDVVAQWPRAGWALSPPLHKLRYAIFKVLWPPTHLWLCFSNHFTKHILNKICNGYILLTTHPPQWHNVICERPLTTIMPLYCHANESSYLLSFKNYVIFRSFFTTLDIFEVISLLLQIKSIVEIPITTLRDREKGKFEMF